VIFPRGVAAIQFNGAYQVWGYSLRLRVARWGDNVATPLHVHRNGSRDHDRRDANSDKSCAAALYPSESALGGNDR
jgi:hypothetical protein